jgi:hypothetical protein
VLAISPSNAVSSQLQQIRELTGVMHRGNNHQFVSPYGDTPFFWEKCHPQLFPYGRGGPSDTRFFGKNKKLGDYAKIVLTRGPSTEGRRFQASHVFIFMAYFYEMRRKIGGVAVTADANQQKTTATTTSSSEPPITQDTDITYTAGDMTQMITFLKEHPNDDDIENLIDNEENPLPPSDEGGIARSLLSDEAILVKLRHFLRRVIPYCTSLPGSPMFIAEARKKLYAILQSNVIRNEACWRWFITFSPADVYDSKFFEIMFNPTVEQINETVISSSSSQAQLTSNIRESGAIKTLRVNFSQNLVKEQRLSMIKSHPALQCRLFDTKIDCVLNSILCGTAKPLGEIVDHWLRSEV